VTDLETVMKHFKRGFAKADRAEFDRSVTEDFEWHMNWYETPEQQPTGKILRGLDEVLAEIRRRQSGWTELTYSDVTETYTPELVVQTFVVSGVYETGLRFNNAAVDLYPVRDGKIARKQTYWKHAQP
jgi:ketosteroid isomerase-like protein